MKVKVRNEQRRASGRERQKRPEDLSSWGYPLEFVHTWGWFAPELMCQAHPLHAEAIFSGVSIHRTEELC